MTAPKRVTAEMARVAVAEPHETPTRNVGMKIFNLVIMAVGGVALWWMIRSTGVGALKAMVLGVGWWSLAIFALDVSSLACDAAALHTFMRPEERMIPYWRVLGAQASGRAINVLTPGGALGEPVKLGLLMSHAPRARVLSSIVLLNLTHAYISIFLMIIGTPITLLLVNDVPDEVKLGAGIGLAALIPATIALGVFIHRGAVSSIVGLFRRTRLISAERATSWKEKLIDVDKHIRELHKNRSAGTWKGILWVGLSKVITWVATAILLLAVGAHISLALVIGVLSIGVLIRWVSSIVPMGLGLADGGNYGLYTLLGASGPVGMAVAMLDRARSVAVAILGLAALAAMQIDRYLGSVRIHRKIREMKAERAAHETPD